jgi:prepilin-type N-terminal cleavage/methylation domain-containing protein
MSEQGDDAGFTLIEVLLAIVILGVAGIVFVTGVGAAVKTSGYHRNEAMIQTILRDEAASLTNAVALCPAATGFTSPIYAPPAGYNVTVAYTSPAGNNNPCQPTTSWSVATITAAAASSPTALTTMKIVLRTP